MNIKSFFQNIVAKISVFESYLVFAASWFIVGFLQGGFVEWIELGIGVLFLALGLLTYIWRPAVAKSVADSNMNSTTDKTTKTPTDSGSSTKANKDSTANKSSTTKTSIKN